MGREIRRVPANWQHPTYRTMRMRRDFYGEIETWKPLLNRSFNEEAAKWDERKEAWDRGERPDYFDADKHGAISFEDWEGDRPDPEYYVPYDVNDDLPWLQMYETVSEGTPVTPAFATADELIDFLCERGQQYEAGETDGPWPRDRAEAFVRNERWFPSGIIIGAEFYDAKTGYPDEDR